MTSIFCLEGDWDDSVRSRESVLPVLELLERLNEAQFYHRDVTTQYELEHHLAKLRRFSRARFPVVYLACHGSETDGELKIDLGGSALSLNELAPLLDGKLAGRILYLGRMVGTARDHTLMQLADATGARAVVGYTAEVSWLESAAFDLLLLPRLAAAKRVDTIFRGLLEHNSSMSDAVGLVVATKAKVYREG
ncbi:DUF6642 family protein [Aeromicrobium sp.]|uniref:DUF6642 family protein n=1 Tax=Aeromicrobium sp. TaxID=1871063 RepID=UPI002FC7CBA0